MRSQATYYGANSWLLEIDGLRVLVDPWLCGSLVFPPGSWFLKGVLPQQFPIPSQLDLLLLTQGLPDHAHPETLKELPKSLPVVGSESAGRVTKRLGFETVTQLRPGDCKEFKGLKIRATAGAAVPNIENGYLLFWSTGSLYLEPHGVLDPEIESRKVDTLITPTVDLGLPLLGAFITGATVMTDLINRFQPQTILASTTGGDIEFSGAISHILKAEGTTAAPEEIPKTCSLITPQVGKPIPLPKGSN